MAYYQNCPNCGAPHGEGNSCDYCGTKYKVSGQETGKSFQSGIVIDTNRILFFANSRLIDEITGLKRSIYHDIV